MHIRNNRLAIPGENRALVNIWSDWIWYFTDILYWYWSLILRLLHVTQCSSINNERFDCNIFDALTGFALPNIPDQDMIYSDLSSNLVPRSFLCSKLWWVPQYKENPTIKRNNKQRTLPIIAPRNLDISFRTCILWRDVSRRFMISIFQA